MPKHIRNNTKVFCPYCCRPVETVEVHGHIQCELCGINIEPCCGGSP